MKRKAVAILMLGVIASSYHCQKQKAVAPELPRSRELGAIPKSTGSSILVDASRDGGVWWFPQRGPFNPDQPHQGKNLADYLRSLGFLVTELPRGVTVDFELLNEHELVIRANGKSYSDSELFSYFNFVSRGGKLLLLSEFIRPDQTDELSLVFGIVFGGITRGSQLMNFMPHPITQGVANGKVRYGVGSGLIEYPNQADVFAALDDQSYLDLNDNSIRDENEPLAPQDMGAMRYVRGQIVFAGDTNFLEGVPQPLTDNILSWFF